MSVNDRIDTLLENSDESVRIDELSKAAAALREASHLDPNHPLIKEKWAALQQREATGDTLELLRAYIGSSQPENGAKVLRSFQQKSIPAQVANESIHILLNVNHQPELLDSLTGTLLSSSSEARKQIAVRMKENVTPLFQLLFERGPASFTAFVSVPLENSLWSSKEAQSVAQRDVFRLSIAKLIEAGSEHLDRVMKAVARLISLAAENVVDLVDMEIFDVILASLDLRLEKTLRSQAMLATSKYFEKTQEKGEEMFATFIHNRVARSTIDDLIVAFSAAAAVFPIVPAVASKLFLTDGFVQQLVPNLEKNWDEGATGHRKSHTLETAALELLSAACVDKTCRESIRRHCTHWLKNLADEREGTHKALAALTLAKISVEASEDMTAKLQSLVLADDVESSQAIEGLAYTTLQPKVKEDITHNSGKLLGKLVLALIETPSSLFGCLTIFANLTKYRPNLSEEQKKMSQLKSYANSRRPEPEDPLDDDAHVTARCKVIMGADLVPALVTSCKQTTSPTNVALIVTILLSLAKEQRHRALMTKQGAVKLLLQIRDRVAKTDKSTTEAAVIEREAAHGLARLLISVNPSHVFSSSLPASSAVSALVPLLSLDQDSEYRDLLPSFEALLALTNLASMEDNSIRDLQLRLLWPQLEDHLLLSSNKLIQRASMELICNLMAAPQCVAKFVGDGSKREATRMQILLALADVEDLATRRAAGGALAMLTEWDAAVSTILSLDQDRGIKSLLGMCEDESDEMIHRGLACMMNVVTAPGEVGIKGINKVKEVDGVQILKNGLTQTKNGEILSLGIEILKKLV